MGGKNCLRSIDYCWHAMFVTSHHKKTMLNIWQFINQIKCTSFNMTWRTTYANMLGVLMFLSLGDIGTSCGIHVWLHACIHQSFLLAWYPHWYHLQYGTIDVSWTKFEGQWPWPNFDLVIRSGRSYSDHFQYGTVCSSWDWLTFSKISVRILVTLT